jgi:hypothetical protein
VRSPARAVGGAERKAARRREGGARVARKGRGFMMLGRGARRMGAGAQARGHDACEWSPGDWRLSLTVEGIEGSVGNVLKKCADR